MPNPTPEEHAFLEAEAERLLLENMDLLARCKNWGLVAVLEESNKHIRELEALRKQHEESIDPEEQEKLRKQIVAKTDEFIEILNYRDKELNVLDQRN